VGSCGPAVAVGHQAVATTGGQVEQVGFAHVHLGVVAILVQDGIDPADLSEEHILLNLANHALGKGPFEPGIVPIENEDAIGSDQIVDPTAHRIGQTA